MPALSDEEILAALPSDARKKIDNAFEALSQSQPSDKERLVLYRVANALKLNPTDTHFSILAAMHYYLQLYQIIPDKIVNAGVEILAAGQTIDQAIRNATRETLTEHTEALNAQSRWFTEKTRQDQIALIGNVAHRIAEGTSAHERQKSLTVAIGAIAVLAVVLYGAGLAQSYVPLGMAMAWVVAMLVGLACGGALCYTVFPRMVIHYVEGTSAKTKLADPNLWSEPQFQKALSKTSLSDRTADACHDVLVGGDSIENAAGNHSTASSMVARGLRELHKPA